MTCESIHPWPFAPVFLHDMYKIFSQPSNLLPVTHLWALLEAAKDLSLASSYMKIPVSGLV